MKRLLRDEESNRKKMNAHSEVRGFGSIREDKLMESRDDVEVEEFGQR